MEGWLLFGIGVCAVLALGAWLDERAARRSQRDDWTEEGRSPWDR